MGWIDIADGLWGLRFWMLPFLGALYLIPILRVIGYPLQYGGRIFMRINRLFGQWEHLIMLPRDTLITLYLVGAIIWHAFVPATSMSEWMHAAAALAAALLIGTGAMQRSFRRRGHMALVEFARRNPSIHPQEFFDYLLCCSGIIRQVLPKLPYRTIDHTDMDFRNGRQGAWVGKGAKLNGLWSTAWLARLLTMASKDMGALELSEAGGALALVWSSRIAQVARARVTVEGREKILPGKGAEIYLFTHMSFLDFALAPLALVESPYAPIFLLAKDHFRDNPIYYRILGIGRAAQALGMIFVERKKKSELNRAKEIVHEASEKLVTKGAGLAIYPQGSRAAPCIDREGRRLNSGYYTVGSRDRIKRDGGHLKKGAAHIAAEAALMLAEKGSDIEVRLIPVAITGTGIACPRGTSNILSNVHMSLRIGETIVIHPSGLELIASPEDSRPTNQKEDAYFDFIHKLHSRIDVSLKTIARVHATLERRFFEDIRDMLDAIQHEEIAVAIKPWRGEDCLFYAILDTIYACPPARWRALHGELIHLLLNFAPRSELLAFKARIADEIPL
ncbi:MAG: 1-acyl-sn-glycerol-3-phosphate acyltransferase [Pseudomonadota bacterium]